ncbi:MAG: tetratricopeptide repeat protein [Nevskiales bacterium]|nr:tetratricopeptide repeat protein [Nevskiales bacterium]
MSHYDDEAQLDQLRRWWRENWMALIGGLVLGLAGIFGWEVWQSSRIHHAEQASQIYEEFKKALPDTPEQRAELAQKLTQEFSGTPYAAQATLLLARQAAEQGDWVTAEKHLNWVVEYADDEGLHKIARLRLARALWQQNRSDEALAQLKVKEDDAFAALYLELRGDIQRSQNNSTAAREAYDRALQLTSDVHRREFLQRKRDNLPQTPS